MNSMIELYPKGFAGFRRFKELMNVEIDIEDAPDAIPAPTFQGRVEYKNVGFGYEEGKKVLEHIDLTVEPGQIHALLGENGAGKSTMMKCLFGSYQKDEGEIILDGHEVSFSGPKDALENGIAMVHQELNQCLERSVVDNLFLGRYPVNSMGIVDEARMKKEAAELFRSLGMTVNLTQPMRNMSVSQRQMCEIAKAISYHSKIIVLDEPTSSLTEPEVRKLFAMMRKLRDQGISLIYISHKMDEIFEICDQVSVLRDGKLVMTKFIRPSRCLQTMLSSSLLPKKKTF